jgi:hypothetical protein
MGTAQFTLVRNLPEHGDCLVRQIWFGLHRHVLVPPLAWWYAEAPRTFRCASVWVAPDTTAEGVHLPGAAPADSPMRRVGADAVPQVGPGLIPLVGRRGATHEKVTRSAGRGGSVANVAPKTEERRSTVKQAPPSFL